jgi:hypothetical protein
MSDATLSDTTITIGPAAPWETAAGLIRLISAHSIWLFDAQRMRYVRVPNDASLATPLPDRAWEPYVALEIDGESGTFSVVLNATRTRVIRSRVAG